LATVSRRRARLTKAMLELKDIQSRFGLSEHQARRLLRALAPVLRGRVRRGRDNRLLLDDGACAIVERAVGLWRSGVALRDLSQTVASELGESAMYSDAVATHERCQACAAREELIRELRADKERLLRLVEELQARIPALPAPARLSRWQALKIVILGRA
jgi:hypothetical protein